MGKRKFQLGDKVRIRQWDDMEQEYGLDESGDINCDDSFVEDMKPLCGLEAIITNICDIDVELDIDVEGWTITTDMLELVEE